MTSAILFNPIPGLAAGVRGVPLASGSQPMDLVPANASGTIVAGVATPGGAIFPTNGIWPTQNGYPPYGFGSTFGRTCWTFNVDPGSFAALASSNWAYLLTSGAVLPLN
jgi:hypothetical protein